MYTPDSFFQEYGFEPAGIIDLKALMGDSSDNIPGVPGIGEKTAKELICRYGSLDGVYDNINSDEIKKGVRAKLEAGKDSAELSYELATIIKTVPMDFLPEDNLWAGDYKPELYDFLKRLGAPCCIPVSVFCTIFAITKRTEHRNRCPIFLQET